MLAFTVLVILILLVGVVMAISILMQNPKGGGLSGAFGGAGSSFGTMLGVRHAADVLQRATWWLAGIFVALIMVLNLFFLPSAGEVQESAIQKASQEAPMPTPQGMPQGAPQQQAPAGGQQQMQQTPAGTEAAPQQQQTAPPPPPFGRRQEGRHVPSRPSGSRTDRGIRSPWWHSVG